MREQTIEKMLNEGFEPVNLKAGNVQVGSAVVNRNVMFGTVKIIKDKISKFGVSIRIYGVRFDEDYQDDLVDSQQVMAYRRVDPGIRLQPKNQRVHNDQHHQQMLCPRVHHKALYRAAPARLAQRDGVHG